jgi:uncharacterized repeat protein (TIGR01451 family)
LRIEAQADSGTAEGTYPNTVSLDNSSLSPPDNGPDNNSDTASIVLGARSDLSITKTVDVNQAEVGDTVLYTIEVFNAGPDIAGGVIVRDVFPVGITLIDDGGNPNLIAGSKETPVGSESVFYDIRDDEWDIGDLEPGFGASIELGATVSSDAEGMPFITNTATITTPDVGLSDSAAFDIVASELNLDLRLRNMNNPNNAGDDGPLVNAPSGDPLTVAEGATIALVVGITNSGTLNAPGVEAEYAIPEGLTFDPAHTLSSGECSLAAPQTISCEFGDVSGGGGSVTREFAVIVNAGTLGETFENTVEITVPVPSDPGSVISDVAFIRVGGADLKVTNEVSNATPRDFETIKYTITVENLGPDDVSNVVIDDRFDASPAHLFWCVFQNNELFDIGPGGIDAETGTFEEKGNGLTNGGSLEWTIPSLPGGATSTLAITARVNICTVAESNSRGGITNTAKVTSFGGVPANSDPVSENNSSAVSITAFGLDTHLFFESLIIDSGDDLFPSDAAETILIDEVRPDGSIVTSNRPLSVFEASEGDNIQFLFFFGDEGGGVSSIPNVSIKSRLSNGLTFVSAFPSASHSNGTVTWSGLTADSTDRAVLLTVSVDGGTTDQELFVTTEISGLPFDGEDDSDPGNINLQFNPRDPDNNKMEDDEDAVVLKIRPVIVNALDDEGPGNPSPGSCTSGHCNLREAIAVANANAGVGVTSVVFEINGIGPHIIKLTSPLQIVQGQLSIDGGGNIILDGSEAGDGATGFQITGGGSTIKGMVINSFAGAGIVLSGSGGSVVEGNFIGTTDQGNEAKPNGNGIRMDNSSSNVIGGDSESHGNVISGNTVNGIVISGESSTLNEVKGNLIGLDKDGAEALPNGTGILINTGAKSNTIGGLTPGKRNVISGNTGDGVRLSGSGVQSNSVIGNFIGTNRDGAVPMPNGGNGVSITNGAVENAVGVSNGTGCVDGCNLISGNTGHGVAIFGSGVSRNTVKGNFIGTDTGGTFDIGNAKFGVSISSFASSNAVGGINGSCTGDCNVISGNDGGGVAIATTLERMTTATPALAMAVSMR